LNVDAFSNHYSHSERNNKRQEYCCAEDVFLPRSNRLSGLIPHHACLLRSIGPPASVVFVGPAPPLLDRTLVTGGDFLPRAALVIEQRPQRSRLRVERGDDAAMRRCGDVARQP
jgi:hypothetical protein